MGIGSGSICTLEVLQPALTLIPVAAAYVRHFSSIEERHYGLQQESILDSEEGNLKSELLHVVVQWFHILNLPNTRYNLYHIFRCDRLSIEKRRICFSFPPPITLHECYIPAQ